MKHVLIASVPALLLASCVSTPPARPAAPTERKAAAFPVRTAEASRGLEAVMGKDVGALKRLFGEPRLDVVEVNGRKLQFAGRPCILDAFLYPDGKDRTEIVTYVDARRGDGAAVDRASCIEALQRR